MQVRHNTTLLERAIELAVQRAAIPTHQARAAAAVAGAAAEKARSEATARKRLATGAAIAIAAIGIGLGVWLFENRPPLQLAYEKRVATAQPVEKPQPPPASSQGTVRLPDPAVPTPPSQQPKNATIDYNKFTNRTVQFLGRSWQITTGHHFVSDADVTWDSAWCYTNTVVEGVTIKVDLANRTTPDARPIAPIASRQTLNRAGLNDTASLALATKCSWLDGKTFDIDEFSIPPSRQASVPAPKPVIEQRGRVLFYNGTIDGDLLGQMKQRDFDVLNINSTGGSVTHSLLAGDWIRSNMKSVTVSTECLSACVFILAAGEIRGAQLDARIGVHRFYSKKQDISKADLEVTQEMSSIILKYLDRMGIDQALFHTMSRVSSEDMAYIDRQTLLNWRLLSSPNGRPNELASMFVAEDGRDVAGNDLPNMPVLNIDQKSCETQCRDNAQCFLYTFNKRSKACFLKTQSVLLFSDATSVVAYRSDRAPKPRLTTMKLLYKKAISGEPLKDLANISFDECASQCERESQCKGVSYQTVRRQCTMMQKIDALTDSPPIWTATKTN